MFEVPDTQYGTFSRSVISYFAQSELAQHIASCGEGTMTCFFCNADFSCRNDYVNHLDNKQCPENVNALAIMAGFVGEAPQISGRKIQGLVGRHSHWKERNTV